MLKKAFILIAAVLLVTATAGLSLAAISAEEAARLGQDLTPLGAERAGNADGTIPAWEGGITTPPAGYVKGQHHIDPYANDQIQFTITAANIEQYRDQLTVGHQALLENYDTFKMNVYPTRRSASVPQRIYDATKEVARTAELVNNGDGVRGTVIGIPFPIPKSGIEVLWNHMLRYRGAFATRSIAQAALTRGGAYTLVQFEDMFSLIYSQEGMTEEKMNNRILMFRQEVTAPARLAGEVLLVHETLDQVAEPRSAWVYNPGQRRVRRAPNVAYDNPGTASDSLRTTDQFDMFNGAPDRYDWKLIGKKELYVPYNSYKLHSNQLKYADVLTPLHLNPEHLRYELHRVWVIEATLRDGSRHLYKKRTFYIDEDSWQIVTADLYDNRDQLWRVSEGHGLNYYEVPTYWTTVEAHYDLQSGRYLAIGMDNESTTYNFDVTLSEQDFSQAALRRAGQR
ncbi:MAG: DUF1329 domain-containing protein [Desulfuromonadales bacterium]|nr:DUF1329 domain-containing protein [Desulfuromonadales bacterium]